MTAGGDKAPLRGNLGDVGHQELIGTVEAETTLNQISGHRRVSLVVFVHLRRLGPRSTLSRGEVRACPRCTEHPQSSVGSM